MLTLVTCGFSAAGDELSAKADPELIALLDRADRFLRDGRLDLAVPLLQKVIDDSRDIVVPVENSAPDRAGDGMSVGIYESYGQRAVRRLRESGADTLRAYHLVADGDAKAVLAAGRRPSAVAADTVPGADDLLAGATDAALGEVVRRYFLSDLGDDAAWHLAGRALDDYDFVSAAVLLANVLDNHPAPSPPRAEILLRFAVATAHLGDRAAALRAIEQVPKSAGGPKVSAQRLTAVADHVRKTLAHTAPEGSAESATLPPPKRETPAAPTGWKFAWTSEWSPPPALWSDPVWMTIPGRVESAASLSLKLTSAGSYSTGYDDLFPAASIDGLVRRGRDAQRLPIPRWFRQGNTQFEKRVDELVRLAENRSPVAHSPHRFRYAPPAGWLAAPSDSLAARPSFPNSPWEAALFADQVHGSLVAHGNLVFSIEGEAMPRTEQSQAASPNPPSTRLPPRWLSARSRTNQLVAYEADTLQVRWRRTASDEETARPDISFLGAPVVHNQRLLIPVLDGTTLLLLALNADDGRTIWRTTLGDEPRSGVSLWSSVGVELAGRDAYLATGAGLIVALNADSGAVRWTARYPRSAVRMRVPAPPAIAVTNRPVEVEGWLTDETRAVGGILLVTATDSDQLIGLDRRNGRLRWSTPRRLPSGEEAQSISAVDGGRVLVSGRNSARAYEATTGRLLWETLLPPAGGRPVLSGHELTVPVESARGATLVSLAATDGRVTREEPVAYDDASPLGNLRLDGDQWSAEHAFRRAGLTRAPSAPAATLGVTPQETGPVSPQPPAGGARVSRLLVSDAAQGQLLEFDLSGRTLGSFPVPGTPGACCGDSAGKRWVVAHQPLEVLEFAVDSKVPAAHFPLSSRPASITAVANDHLLMTFPAKQQVVEWNRRGKPGWSASLLGRPVDARRLPDNRTLVALMEDRRVVEVDDAGQIVWESADVVQPRWVQRLDNGRTLVTSWGVNQLFEWSENGRDVAWSRLAQRQVYAAARLPDQRTAVADANGLQVVGPDGQVVWKIDGLLVTGLSAY